MSVALPQDSGVDPEVLAVVQVEGLEVRALRRRVLRGRRRVSSLLVHPSAC